MTPLVEYVLEHTERGECKCGACIDVGSKPEPTGHTADLIFFKVVAANKPDKDEFIRLTKEHVGDYGQPDLFDGAEHGYMELGGWIGDQGLAMQFMGLGFILGVFQLLTPNILGNMISPEQKMQMAGNGMLTVIAKA